MRPPAVFGQEFNGFRDCLTVAAGMAMPWGSEAQENLPAVHPIDGQGDQEKAGHAGHDALHFGAEHEHVALAEVGSHGLGEPDFQDDAA